MKDYLLEIENWQRKAPANISQTWQNTIKPIIISGSVYICCSAMEHDISQTINWFYLWHTRSISDTIKKWICNGYFVASSVDGF